MWGQYPTLIFVWGHLPPLPTYSCTYVHVYLLNNYTHVRMLSYLANNWKSNVKLFAMYEITKRSYRPVPGLFLAIHQ